MAAKPLVDKPAEASLDVTGVSVVSDDLARQIEARLGVVVSGEACSLRELRSIDPKHLPGRTFADAQVSPVVVEFTVSCGDATHPCRALWAGREHDGGMAEKKNETPESDNSSIKDPEMYEALRREGNSKSKAAAISNAAANSSREEVGRKGGRAEDYEDMTVDELHDKAADLGIEGRSSMTKDELITALRKGD